MSMRTQFSKSTKSFAQGSLCPLSAFNLTPRSIFVDIFLIYGPYYCFGGWNVRVVRSLFCYVIGTLQMYLWWCCVVSPAYTFLTLDVIEAMCSCLIAEAEDGEQSRRSDLEQELRIVTEFGRCLTQVIDSASRTRGSSTILHTVHTGPWIFFIILKARKSLKRDQVLEIWVPINPSICFYKNAVEKSGSYWLNYFSWDSRLTVAMVTPVVCKHVIR